MHRPVRQTLCTHRFGHLWVTHVQIVGHQTLHKHCFLRTPEPYAWRPMPGAICPELCARRHMPRAICPETYGRSHMHGATCPKTYARRHQPINLKPSGEIPNLNKDPNRGLLTLPHIHTFTHSHLHASLCSHLGRDLLVRPSRPQSDHVSP